MKLIPHWTDFFKILDTAEGRVSKFEDRLILIQTKAQINSFCLKGMEYLRLLEYYQICFKVPG